MPQTYALFETATYVRATVNALSKNGFERSNLTFIGRDLDSDTGEQDDRKTTIAQVLKSLDLAPIAIHLDPLALVVIPEGGTFLTAGWAVRHFGDQSYEPGSKRMEMHDFLGALGNTDDEAEFLGGRLQAGALFLGVGEPDEDAPSPVREIFADQQAVYVGLVDFDTSLSVGKGPLLPPPNSQVTGDVVVVDVAVGVVGADEQTPANGLIGIALVDEASKEIGKVTATLSAPERESGWPPAYVVVERGGFLGVGQSLHVLPFELLTEREHGNYQLHCGVDVIENAPAFDARLPLSRREKEIVCAYYGTMPNWET